jgi:RNA polymerase sigma-70 factor (ECF subfamily)
MVVGPRHRHFTSCHWDADYPRFLPALRLRARGLRALYAPGEGMSDRRQLDPGTLGDHIDRLYRAAWALCGSREEAEDLVQETYERVLRRPRFLHSDDDIGYLLRVLRNTFVSSRRTAARRPQTAPLPDQLDLMADPNAVRPESGLESAELYAAIAALPADFRDALVAIDLVGLSYGEAARALKVREATITTRLHRARQRVARALADGAEPGADPLALPAPERSRPSRRRPGG